MLIIINDVFRYLVPFWMWFQVGKISSFIELCAQTNPLLDFSPASQFHV